MSTENTSFRFTAEEETPVHGHTELTEEQVEAVNEQLRDIADVPAIEIISSAAIHMMSAAAVKCGLAADENADDLKDLDEARKLITALAGLVTAAAPEVGSQHAAPLRDGLRTLQLAFREASPFPDEPGKGPGEKLTGPVYSTVPGLFTAKPRLPHDEEDGASSYISLCGQGIYPG